MYSIIYQGSQTEQQEHEQFQRQETSRQHPKTIASMYKIHNSSLIFYYNVKITAPWQQSETTK